MNLIVDSGSTKTDWTSTGTDCADHTVQTAGCNPYFMDGEEMERLFSSAKDSMTDTSVESIWFYGAGCTPGDKTERVREALAKVFGRGCRIEVASDMLGVARAVCGRGEGIACILGTGSNSCLYDGREIVANTPALGFILGDEGSGANLGKLFVGSVLKDRLGAGIKKEFLDTFGPVNDIIDRVYRRPMPNRWLASLSPFIHDNLHVDAVRQLVHDAFRDFFTRNITNYNRPDLKIGIIGSVGFHYKDIISQTARELELQTGIIAKSPTEGLKAYHHGQH